MPVAQVAEQLQCLGQAGGSGRVVPGQPLHHAQALKGSGLTEPQIGERQYISRRTVQSHLVYVFAQLDIACRAPSSPPRSPATTSRSRPGTGRTGWDSALPGELPRGAHLPGTVRSLQQTAESSGFTAQPGPVRDDGSAGWRMSYAARGGTVETVSPREGDGRRGRRRLIVTEEL